MMVGFVSNGIPCFSDCGTTRYYHTPLNFDITAISYTHCIYYWYILLVLWLISGQLLNSQDWLAVYFLMGGYISHSSFIISHWYNQYPIIGRIPHHGWSADHKPNHWLHMGFHPFLYIPLRNLPLWLYIMGHTSWLYLVTSN